jgi:hypothetical protein
MSDIKESVVVALLGPILEVFVNRNKRKTAQTAGALTFWQDGMLKKLESIAEGKATSRTFTELRKQYDKSEGGVTKAMKKLVAARDKLAGTAIARQIDAILHSDHSGKMNIRHEIDLLLSTREDLVSEHYREWDGKDDAWKTLADDAARICNMIRVFNAEVERLNRMVNEP